MVLGALNELHIALGICQGTAPQLHHWWHYEYLEPALFAGQVPVLAWLNAMIVPRVTGGAASK